ncbi:uncharacterized protein LOC132701026 [Cylas formicarius]|uniref:uncharacterized protein LOC132701026 n=1 Tax=Cylas formicarius TaxID=197179 RepID=UPI002958BD8A|nr:uncharacterized protein LOC132701026 [Cylas formicarius]
MQKAILFVVATLAVVGAESMLLEDEEGRQFYLQPILSRHRRQDKPQLFGGGGANGQQQGGVIGIRNPNGSGGSIGYGHAKGYGHDVSLDAMVPVWQRGQSTVNVGGGVTHHFGGYGGDRTLDRRVGINFNHRF